MKPTHHISAPTSLFLLARTILGLALSVFQGYAQTTYEPYTFSTIAGRAGVPGGTDGMNGAARFGGAVYMEVDAKGHVYMADRFNNTIRKMTPVGTDWVVTTIAGKADIRGNVDGTGDAARFSRVTDVAVDAAGNLYVVDQFNHAIRKVTPVGEDWVVTTIAGKLGVSGRADGTNGDARFSQPSGLAVDSAGHVYVADTGNHTIRKLTPVGTDWVVTTIAGKAGVLGSVGRTDGMGDTARFSSPIGIEVDSAGHVYVVDLNNHRIRKVTSVGADWVVTTIAGSIIGSADGPGSAARFNYPETIAMDRAGNLYVADGANHTIRKMTPVGTGWVVTTLAGRVGFSGRADGTGSTARFDRSHAVAVDSAGNLYTSDYNNFTIRKGVPALAMVAPGFQGGQFGFDLRGPAGMGVVVESSTDLVNWKPLRTETMTGPLKVRDPESGVHPTRYYRARAQ